LDIILATVINGILMGGVYGLTAMGLTLIFGVMKVINFAHGSFLMAAMFATFYVFQLTGIDPYLGLVITVPLLFAFGYFVQHVLIRPVFKVERDVREPIGVLLLTAGLWIFMDNLALAVFGAFYKTIKTSYKGAVLHLGEVIISLPRLYAFLTTVVLAVLFFLFLKKTRLGRAIRATGQDRHAAQLMGINIYRIYDVAFGIGIAIVGVAGAVLLPFYYVHPYVGVVFDIRAFIIVVLGGLGSIPGALLGGLIIGLVESFGAQFMTATWTEGIIYAIFITVLFLKPEGLFGFKAEW
jgi:branched-chain amino acid transport system permease protein